MNELSTDGLRELPIYRRLDQLGLSAAKQACLIVAVVVLGHAVVVPLTGMANPELVSIVLLNGFIAGSYLTLPLFLVGMIQRHTEYHLELHLKENHRL